jgi:hypothetical protein
MHRIDTVFFLAGVTVGVYLCWTFWLPHTITYTKTIFAPAPSPLQTEAAGPQYPQ